MWSFNPLWEKKGDEAKSLKIVESNRFKENRLYHSACERKKVDSDEILVEIVGVKKLQKH